MKKIDDPQGANDQGIIQDRIDNGDVESPRRVDVFFVFDKSPSMKDDIMAVKDNIDLFTRNLENISLTHGKEVDWRIGLVAADASFRWEWLDLTQSLDRFKVAIANLELGRADEATPHCIDYTIEHAQWREMNTSRYIVVMTDEPAEAGIPVPPEGFKALLAKLASRRIGVIMAGTPNCFKDKKGKRSLYALFQDQPRSFVNDRLREDRGERLISWIANSASRTDPGQKDQISFRKDIFECFLRVKCIDPIKGA